MLSYDTKMMKMSYDSILYVLENVPQTEEETQYLAVTKYDQFVVRMTDKNKNGFVKHYITHKGENFDCSAALDAALNRKPTYQG